MNHRLVLAHPETNRHIWEALCSCGAWDCRRRRKQDAAKQYRRHVSIVGLGSRGFGYKPRTLTPADRLPLDLLPLSVSFT